MFFPISGLSLSGVGGESGGYGSSLGPRNVTRLAMWLVAHPVQPVGLWGCSD